MSGSVRSFLGRYSQLGFPLSLMFSSLHPCSDLTVRRAPRLLPRGEQGTVFVRAGAAARRDKRNSFVAFRNLAFHGIQHPVDHEMKRVDLAEVGKPAVIVGLILKDP